MPHILSFFGELPVSKQQEIRSTTSDKIIKYKLHHSNAHNSLSSQRYIEETGKIKNKKNLRNNIPWK